MKNLFLLTQSGKKPSLPRVLGETFGLFVLLMATLFWGQLSPILFLQGLDMLAFPTCALYAAIRFPKDHALSREIAVWLSVFLGFMVLRWVINFWAYGYGNWALVQGPNDELSRLLFCVFFYFTFFRCTVFAFLFLAKKKSKSLHWRMTFHLMTLGFGLTIAVTMVTASIYASSDLVATWIEPNLGLYAILIHRLVLGFLIYFSLGFSLAVILSPLFFLFFVLAAGFSTRSINAKLSKLSDVTQSLTDTLPSQPPALKQERTETLERNLNTLAETWTHTVDHLHQQQDDLQKQLQAQSHWVATVSHELRTPLTLAKAYLERAKHQAAPAKASENTSGLEQIETQLDQVQRLLCDLETAKAAPQIQPQPFALGDLIQQTVSQWRAYAWDKYRVSLFSELDQSVSMVALDPQRVRQILVNLIHNALRFTDPGGVVGIRLKDRGRYQLMQVCDTGSGIDAADLDRIWEPLYTAEITGKSQTGLGLALVKDLVHAMGCQVQVQSQPGEGSTFSIRIPCEMETKSRQLHDFLETRAL